jgi:hypothetical protein
MKRIILITVIFLCLISVRAQTNKIDQLQALEQTQTDNQKIIATAKLKSSTRLFAAKDDLTTVILIIPADSVVSVLGSDSTYLHVLYQDNEGYIFSRHIDLNPIPANQQQLAGSPQSDQDAQPVSQEQQSRFSYLENKYGTNMAARLVAGKIWKGMNSEMVKDSWGVAERINRVISGNTIKEQWFYRSTLLYFENNTLIDWGPVKR